MADVEDTVCDRLRRIEAADDIGPASVFNLQLAAGQPVNFSREEIVGFAPNRVAVDEGDVAQLAFAGADGGRLAAEEQRCRTGRRHEIAAGQACLSSFRFYHYFLPGSVF
jgi:hypothetical protein